ncbi:hypothetical protein GCM10009760_52840 [Kitasatospora kazusensis]|uniref:Uncharacterized protein n=1 Tax=Kitasatospora kazusensis TaxID=407974 RepID=A0ABN3A5R3_9ACTN
MRSIIPFGPGQPRRALVPGEMVIVVVIMILATALVIAGQTMAATLEFLGGAVFLACRTVKGLRDLPTAGI